MKINDSGHTFCRLTPTSKIAIPKRIKTAGNSTLSHFSSASAMPGRVATNRAAHTRGATRIKKTTQ